MKMYLHTYDPFVACTAAAAATRRPGIAAGVCLVVQGDPITAAKEVASVDRLGGDWMVSSSFQTWSAVIARNSRRRTHFHHPGSRAT
jgi:alkanesulfonate monooxygenase SsuD/methylene tetrahydromethanopterin reductase-like flavin-dependent oxidoreductase (luciferase family)